MAILKCEHCECTKEIPSQYAAKTVKCPSCGQPTKVHDTIDLLTLFSEKLSEFEVELKRITIAPPPKPDSEFNDELTQVLSKISRDHRIAMTEFNEATKKRDVITQRTERRALYLLRLGSLGLLAVIALLVFFIFELTTSIKTISQPSPNINDSVKSISKNLIELKADLAQLNTTTTLPKIDGGIVTSATEVNQNVAKMQSSMEKVQDKIGKMSDNIAYLADQVEHFIENESNSFKYRYYRPQ